MNFGLMISCKVEEKLAKIQRPDDWNSDDETLAYETCLQEVLQADERAWAEGNIRIGDYILLSKSADVRLLQNANMSQLTLTPASLLTVFLMRLLKWNNHPTSASFNFPPESCK
jgi:hypothetical protein